MKIVIVGNGLAGMLLAERLAELKPTIVAPEESNAPVTALCHPFPGRSVQPHPLLMAALDSACEQYEGGTDGFLCCVDRSECKDHWWARAEAVCCAQLKSTSHFMSTAERTFKRYSPFCQIRIWRLSQKSEQYRSDTHLHSPLTFNLSSDKDKVSSKCKGVHPSNRGSNPLVNTRSHFKMDRLWPLIIFFLPWDRTFSHFSHS